MIMIRQGIAACSIRIAARRFFPLILMLLALTACDDPSANTIKSELTSPDGKYVATAFIHNGGATVDFSPQVSLRPAGRRMASRGNVFIGYHSDQIRIEWLSASQLVVYCDCSVTKHETNYHGITIEKRRFK
jgi:hypothetical protein